MEAVPKHIHIRTFDLFTCTRIISLAGAVFETVGTRIVHQFREQRVHIDQANLNSVQRGEIGDSSLQLAVDRGHELFSSLDLGSSAGDNIGSKGNIRYIDN